MSSKHSEFHIPNSALPGEARILHLYYDLMNLYGDWANAAVLARKLALRGCKAVVERKSVGENVDFSAYNYIYIGSGTERSQRACMSDMTRHADALIECVEAGTPLLATGNAHELFGRAVTTAGGERYEALGLLEFETVQRDTRVTGDCVCGAAFLPDKLVGFINRAGGGQQGAIDRPFLTELGPGADETTRTEGIRYKNLLGTYLTGPILVRNPPLLTYFTDMLFPESGAEPGPDDPFFGFQEKAYRKAVSELMGGVR